MKKYLNKLILVVVLMTASLSCSDEFLELTPRSQELEGNAYITEEDAFSAVTAIYDALAVQNWNFVPLQSDIVSDDLFAGGEAGGGMGQWQEQERSVISVENGAATDLWNRCYSGIYRANFYMFKEGGIEWTSEENRKRMMAEARLLRAYFYWDLVRHYGWVPIIREFIENPEEYKDLTQSTPQEVYQFIAEDILAALPDLPYNTSAAEKGRVTKDVARMLLGRIYLYREGFAKNVLGVTGDWTNGSTVIDRAYVAAQIDSIITSGRYSLPEYAEVFDWENDNGPESIFEWQYSEQTALGGEGWGNIWGVDGNFSVQFFGPRDPEGDETVAAGWSFGTISWSLYDEFEAGDPRRDVTVYDAEANLTKYTIGYQNTGWFNRKYMARADYLTGNGEPSFNHRRNYIDMRLAEAYLIGAELYLNVDNDKATDYLNEVRTRAMGPANAKSSITLDDIYHERRVELAGEGHRKWDLLRRGLDYAKEKIDASMEVPEGTPNENEFLNKTFDPNTWGMLPIPASEIRLMNPGKMEQFVPAFK